MESFGEYLKSLREEKGLTLAQMSEQTKVALTNLELLEKDRYDLLPPRVFVRGFIQSYVQALDLESEQALREFENFIRQGEAPNYEHEEHPPFHRRPPSRPNRGRKIFNIGLTAAGIIALGILLLTGVTRLFFSEPPNKTIGSTGRTQGLPSVGPSPRQPIAPKLSEGPVFDQPAPKQTGKKVLEIKALSNAWLRITSDDGPAEELTMSAGDVQIFTARNGFQIQTGNAGGVRFRYDGKELPVMGKENQTLSLSLP